ncbi:AsnC family transcriptional regulator [Pseudomonadota bacterium]
MNTAATQEKFDDQSIDEIDRQIIVATQSGLPICPRPYHEIANSLGLEADEVMQRMQRMLELGVIRRIGVVPNHYALGFRANAMSVWDVDDEQVAILGGQIGNLEFVSHCYQRPRHLPEWPYNMFAMIHGRSRPEVETKAKEIATLLSSASRSHELIYSTKILKKTGLRLHDSSKR